MRNMATMNRRITEMEKAPPCRRACPPRMSRTSFGHETGPRTVRTHHSFMKNQTLLMTFLAVAAFSVGCKPSDEKTAASSSDTTAQQMDKLKNETKEAAQDMKDYAYAQKAEFVEKMNGQMAEINKDLDTLSAKIEKSNDAAKAEAKPKLEALRAQAAKLNKQLDEAKGATESTWNDVKAGFKKGYEALKDGFQQTRQWLSDKIAP